jgi:hypothetical protein
MVPDLVFLTQISKQSGLFDHLLCAVQNFFQKCVVFAEVKKSLHSGNCLDRVFAGQ